MNHGMARDQVVKRILKSSWVKIGDGRGEESFMRITNRRIFIWYFHMRLFGQLLRRPQ